MELHEASTILFQGDSITDAGRRESPDGLGGGYVSMIQGILAARSPKRRFKILNRGVGGDRTVELLSRWNADCLDLKPALLSIMIGVNDVWRLRGDWNGQKFVPFSEYCANYRKLAGMALDSGVSKFALMSPSAIFDNQDEEISAHLDERAAFVKSLASELNAVYVPVREVQKQAMKAYPELRWTGDGCHPTPAGHALIAQAWLDSVGL